MDEPIDIVPLVEEVRRLAIGHEAEMIEQSKAFISIAAALHRIADAMDPDMQNRSRLVFVDQDPQEKK